MTSSASEKISEIEEAIRTLMPALPALGHRVEEMAGQLSATSVLLSALVKTHPDKAALQAALREIHKLPGLRDANLSEAHQAGFDKVYGEVTSHLRER